jgi:hypothetical protein
LPDEVASEEARDESGKPGGVRGDLIAGLVNIYIPLSISIDQNNWVALKVALDFSLSDACGTLSYRSYVVYGFVVWLEAFRVF